MKVLLFNGSPNKEGCTYTALNEVAQTLKEEGIECTLYHIGDGVTAGCKGCRACAKLGKCVIDDKVNEFNNLMANYDALVIGSPVYYASANGSAISFLDRAFYSASRSGNGHIYRHKPGFAIVSARRAGTTATLDELNKYFMINQMPVISGRYWNMVHGNSPEEVMQDVEGLQNMRFLARNLAWHLRCVEASEKLGVEKPKQENVIHTNFI